MAKTPRLHPVPPLRESLWDLAFIVLGGVAVIYSGWVTFIEDNPALGMGLVGVGVAFLLTTEHRQTRRALNFLTEAYAREHPEAVVDWRSEMRRLGGDR